MRCALLLSLALFLSGCQGGAQPVAVKPVFRHITISSGERIELGQPLPHPERAEEQIDGSFRLARGAFSGAESIRVFVTAEGRVAGLRFDYAAGTDAEAAIADYTETCGKAPSDDDGVATWDDGTTVFQYARVEPPHALLYDTALWPRRIGG